ncbi:MAG: ligase-associated DNA damage response exonuclease [Notoacmeibacter sp.]
MLVPKPEGLYCESGGFFIDPVCVVDRALITHGHADHARPGHANVLATRQTLEIMAIRYGLNFCGTSQAAGWGETIQIKDAKVSFHPAGHVLGSAQIRVEAEGQIIVVSGDYKRRPDPTCAAFEPVACDVFVTEATFGLPVFRHPDTITEISKVSDALAANPERCVIIGAYALGKAQRVIRALRDSGYEKPIYLHGSMAPLCNYYESQGIALGQLEPATVASSKSGAFAGSVVIGPPSAIADRWGRRFPDPIIAFASGWMRVRQRAKQRGVELPLIISDHSDWDELTTTISELNPQEVWVTHGREEALVRWCQLRQISAMPLNLVGYDDEAE